MSSTTTRSIHQGRHIKEIEKSLEKKMNNALEKGAQKNYTQEQYSQALSKIIKQEKQALKEGERALNKNKRPWAKSGENN